MAVGAAITERFLVQRFGEWMAHKTYAFISDGGVQEEISQGAGRIAGYLGLNNLIMFYDSNDIQLSTETDAVTTEDTAAKYKAWGWDVVTIDGNNIDEIRIALKEAHSQQDNHPDYGKPSWAKAHLQMQEPISKDNAPHMACLLEKQALLCQVYCQFGRRSEKPIRHF